MIRGGKIAMAILGAMEVAENGDLANWMIPGKKVKGMGGAMDLVAGAKRVIVAMDHVSKRGKPKLLKECALPLTGKRVVHEVVTDLGYFRCTPEGLVLVEIAPGVTVEEIRESIRADSLGYLSLEGLRSVANQLKHGHCDACFSADYPVQIDPQQSVPQLSLFRSVDEREGEKTEGNGRVPDA